MAEDEADFTLVFRHLANALETDDAELISQFHEPTAITEWLQDWRTRLNNVDNPEGVSLMRRTNPIFIPRNHRIEEAIQAGNNGDYEPFYRLIKVLQRPFEEQPEFAEYENAPAPEEIVRATFCGT